MKPVARLVRSLAIVHALTLGLASCALFRSGPPEYAAIKMASGVVVQDLVVPEEGPTAALGDIVRVHYELELEDGTQVDSSYDRGQPVETTLGEGFLPRGIEQGIHGMRVFGRRSILVPSELGYGSGGLEGRVPPDAVLHVVVELMALVPRPLP